VTQPFRLQGTDLAIRRLKQFGPQLQKKGLGRSLRKGAVIVKNAAVQNAKRIDDESTAAKIWRSILIKTDTRLGRRNGGLAFKVGVRGGARKTKTGSASMGQTPDLFYWRFVEFGTSRTTARPFLRPALADNVERVTAAVAVELNRAVGIIAERGRG